MRGISLHDLQNGNFIWINENNLADMTVSRKLINMRTDTVAGDKQLLRWKVEQATDDFWLAVQHPHSRQVCLWIRCQELLFMKGRDATEFEKKSSFVHQRESTLCSLVKHFDILWSTLLYCAALINLQLHGHIFPTCYSANNKTAAVTFHLKTEQTPPTTNNPLDWMACFNDIMPQVAITINSLGQTRLNVTDGSVHKGQVEVMF